MQARLLLVHSPLVGCGAWEPIAKDLAGDGYAVTVPDLAGTVTAGPPYHLRQAQVIAGSAGRPARGPHRAQRRGAAAGHGRDDAGRGSPGLHLRRRPAADAGALLDGDRAARSRGPAAGDGRPAGLAAAVVAMVGRGGTGRASARSRLSGSISQPGVPGCRWPCSRKFIRPRRGGQTLPVAISSSARHTRTRRPGHGELGWPVRRQLSHHLALLTEPGQVARELRELIGQL